MPKGRTLQEYTEHYFANHPEEIDDFLKESFEEYAKDGDSKALLSQLRVIAIGWERRHLGGTAEASRDAGVPSPTVACY